MVRCPECDSSQTLDICFFTSGGYAAVPYVQRNKMIPKHSGIKARACTKCGKIFDFRLEKPENLAPFAGVD